MNLKKNKNKKKNKSQKNQTPKIGPKKKSKLFAKLKSKLKIKFLSKEEKQINQNKKARTPKKQYGGTPLLTGRIKRHADGFGFFIPEDSSIEDIYIGAAAMNGAMTNDQVEIEVFERGARSRGEIVRIIERHVKNVTGIWRPMSGNRGIVLDEGNGWGEDLKVIPSGEFKVKSGEWVHAEVSSYPDSYKGFWGKIVEVIGAPGDIETDYRRILLQSGVPIGFSEAAQSEAERYGPESVENEIKNRKDLRNTPFITIDGKTAKDFDDAIFVEATERGFHVQVAIADVSHYVYPGSELDKEAYQKGTSTYFPGFVEPMIPEHLSNGLCSLRPDEDRLALVADIFTLSSGEIESTKFYEAVIKSHGRLTYGEAQEILDETDSKRSLAILSLVGTAGKLAKILLAKRLEKGSLELEISESAIEIDSSGVPVDIMKGERLFAHRLIEEMMLLTNIAVAQKAGQSKVDFLYRVHDVPKAEKLAMLEKFLNQFGSSQNLEGGKLQIKITKALSRFSGQKEGHILNILALRSMCQATYSAENIGHFGLGFKDYCHFTSPIRRYPDLWIHRFIKLQGENGRKMKLREGSEASDVGTWLSACEQRSVKAERQINSILKARFMRQFVGEEFEGIISSSTKFGIFVIIREYDVDGLVRVESFPGDNYQFDEENLLWVGKKSGRTYGLGDMIKIQVQAVNEEKGLIDFGIVGGKEVDTSKTQKVQASKKRRSAKKNSIGVRKTRLSGSRRKGKAR